MILLTYLIISYTFTTSLCLGLFVAFFTLAFNHNELGPKDAKLLDRLGWIMILAPVSIFYLIYALFQPMDTGIGGAE